MQFALALWLCGVSLHWLAANVAAVQNEHEKDVTRILFGSCNKVEKPQPLWEPIIARGPDLWIWGGDSIYADRKLYPTLFPKPHNVFEPADPARLRELYAEQGRQPGYVQLLNSSVPIIGTWDDHDFGLDDSDRRYQYRNESQHAFLDFIGEPASSARREQHGVYAAYKFDYGGEGRSVLVVLLDLRFNKDPYGTPDGDFLGEQQWHWLEQTFTENKADVNIIMSSLQFLQARPLFGENWNRFPNTRKRFLELLARHNVSVPIVLSGDVHLAELGLGSCSGGQLLEITSSGMTHSWGAGHALTDYLKASLMTLAQSIVPWRYQMRDASSGSAQYFLGLNFGELEFHWPSQRVNVMIRGEGGITQLQESFPFSHLGVGAKGVPGVADFGPARGEPETWRTVLGTCVLLAVTLLLPMGVLACAVLLACRVLRRSKASDSDSEPLSDSGDVTTESDTDGACVPLKQ